MSIHIKNPRSTYMHVPKTGGESVSEWLRPTAGHAWKGNQKHATFQQMKSSYGNLGFTWAVVRNPWDRLVSGYHYYHRKNARILRKKNNPIRDFEHFLQTENWGKTLMIPQWKFAPPQTDLVLRFETLHEDFKQIQDFYKKQQGLPHKNRSHHKHYSEYYTEQWMIDVVEKHYGEDIKRFDYEFTYK